MTGNIFTCGHGALKAFREKTVHRVLAYGKQTFFHILLYAQKVQSFCVFFKTYGSIQETEHYSE